MKNYDTLSEELLKLWEPGVVRLRQGFRGDERLFSGLVAFCGFQLSLWPLWLRSCADHGRYLSDDVRNFDLDDDGIHSHPWFVVSYPVATQAAWVQVHGSGLPDSKTTWNALTHRDVVQSLSYLDSKGKVMFYGESRDILARLGAFRGADEPLNLPLAHCYELARQWYQWQEAALHAFPFFSELAGREIAVKNPDHDLRLTFLHTANKAWEKMNQKGLIQIGSYQRTSILSRMGFGKKTDHFSGIMLLYGDYTELWQTIQKEIAR